MPNTSRIPDAGLVEGNPEMRWETWWFALLATVAFLAPESAADEPLESLGTEIANHVRDKFFDSAAAMQWHGRRREFWKGSRSRADFDLRCREALADLKVSHVGYYTPADFEYHALISILGPGLGIASSTVEHIQADLRADGFVRRVFAGGAAESAGIRRGDRIVAVGQKPFKPVDSFRGLGGRTVVAAVQTSADESPKERDVAVIRSELRQEWLLAIRNGRRLMEIGGRKIAYLPVFCGAGEIYEQEVRKAMQEWEAAADGLIVDFRGGWGGCSPSFVDLFNRTTPRLELIDRNRTVKSIDVRWTKPAVILIDGGTRSGKEMVCHALKKHRLATLVGERTAGAVVAGQGILLSDRALLYLAVADVRVDGVRLEGVGVDPDIAVADRLEFCGGRDPQLETAMKAILKQLSAR